MDTKLIKDLANELEDLNRLRNLIVKFEPRHHMTESVIEIFRSELKDKTIIIAEELKKELENN